MYHFCLYTDTCVYVLIIALPQNGWTISDTIHFQMTKNIGPIVIINVKQKAYGPHRSFETQVQGPLINIRSIILSLNPRMLCAKLEIM